jgi:hypothetical protein
MRISKSVSKIGCLLIVVTGCAASDAAGNPVMPSQSDPSRPLEGTPAPADIDEALGVFVLADAPQGDGTRTRPFGTIGKAIEIAKAFGKRVYVCDGTYRESLVLADGVSVTGGFECKGGSWKIGSGRSRIEAPVSPAIVAKQIAKPTRFERFDVVAPNGKAPSESSIGLLAVESAALVIASARIVAGDGSKGEDGAPAITLTQVGSPHGKPGVAASDYCADKRTGHCRDAVKREPGGAGGVAQCAGAPGHDAESGSTGGSGGVFEVRWLPSQLNAFWATYQGNSAVFGTTTADPRSGAPGADGTMGRSAQRFGTFSSDGFVPANGMRGTDGAPGRAGQGGEGVQPTMSTVGLDLAYGTSGSGGGAGGCAGLAGTEGKGGGASVGAIVVASAMTFDGVELVAGSGGAGGKGSFPSRPSAGGIGGPPINGIAATRGGDGGSGGSAGVSGSGAGGPSIGLAHDGDPPKMIATTARPGKPGLGVDALFSDPTRRLEIDPSAGGVAKDVLRF